MIEKCEGHCSWLTTGSLSLSEGRHLLGVSDEIKFSWLLDINIEESVKKISAVILINTSKILNK